MVALGRWKSLTEEAYDEVEESWLQEAVGAMPFSCPKKISFSSVAYETSFVEYPMLTSSVSEML